MAKKIMQDVVTKKTSSMGRIQVPTWSTPTKRPLIERKTPAREVKSASKTIKESRKERFAIGDEEIENVRMTEIKSKKPRRRYGVWFVAFASILFLVSALSFLFSKAHIVITPKTQIVSSTTTISAIKNSGTTTPSFDLVVISGQETMKIDAEEKREISESATGKVIIYNTFSTATQRLSVDTRLEGSNGKIYKTTKEVVVPGMKQDGTPGSIAVDIYASEAGESYNSGPLDFKIFGFKGTPRYEKFYARSTTPINGGLVGNLPFVSPALKASSVSSLESKLKSTLFNKISDQTPEGFVLFKEAAFLSITEENVDYSNTEEGSVSITLKGTLYGFLLNEDKLTRELAKKNLKNYDGSPLYVSNIDKLNFILSNKENISFPDTKSISFTLNGDVEFVWEFDEEEFISNILGKTKGEFDSLLTQYNNIENADLSIRPFWRMSLPDKKEGLEIVVNYPQ